MTVILSPTAVGELYAIWEWNAEHYSPSHADAYVGYLKHRIGHLAKMHAKGKPVSIRPDLRYILVRRKSKGHGHLVVYRVQGQEVHVLHIFHTSQDWQAALA